MMQSGSPARGDSLKLLVYGKWYSYFCSKGYFLRFPVNLTEIGVSSQKMDISNYIYSEATRFCAE